jgi:DNA-binding LacI/PurR family transcriptional regulator
VTLNDLAKELHLSIATMSRALSRPETVAPETRRRVLEAVKKSGYRPNGIARSLRTQETRTIGIVVSDIRNPFFAAIVKAVDDVARANRYTVLICNADEDGKNEEAALQLFLDRQVSGVIHCSTGANLDLLHEFQRRGVPIIDLDRQSGLEDVDTVVLDNEAGASLAANHLVELGHRRIGFIAGPRHLSNSQKRLEGFRKALRRAGVLLTRDLVEYGDFREESGYQAARKLLELPNPPSALFVSNNEMTAGALAAIRDRGVRVPRDLSLVGFDDARWARYLDPPLTVVAQPTQAMGQKAGEMLLTRLRRKNGPQLAVFEPQLVIRGSTARVRGSAGTRSRASGSLRCS